MRALSVVAACMLLTDGVAGTSCNVTYDAGHWHNSCPYAVLVSYTVFCPYDTFRNMSEGPIPPGGTTDGTAWENCRLRWSWKRVP
jgi:hypothetical protein